MKKHSLLTTLALALALTALQAWAWSPLSENQPALEQSQGLFGNPALLSGDNGPGWLLSYSPDSVGASNLRLGIRAGTVGGSFQWLRNETTGRDDSRWNMVAGLPLANRIFSAGLTGTLWRSSAFTGNAWSLSPGLLLRPLSWMSLGWSWQGMLATNAVAASQQMGIALRPLTPWVIALSTYTPEFRKGWLRQAPWLARTELHFASFELGFSAALRGRDSIPSTLSIGVPIATLQSAYLDLSPNKLRRFGVSGQLARRPTPLANDSWVRFALTRPVVETHSGFAFLSDDNLSLPDVLRQFRHIAADPAVKGVFFDFDGFAGGPAAAAELRRGITNLRRHGKGTIAYLTEIRPSSYYAASAAERVVLQPSSRVNLRGLSADVMHYKGLLDFLGVKAELMRHGRYKSAVEPFTQDTMSTEARADLETLLNGFWSTVRDSIAFSRHVSPDSVDAIARLAPLTASAARAAGLVDTVLYYDQIPAYAKQTGFAEWKIQEREPYRDDWRHDARVAVITFEGDIVDGPGGRKLMGGSRNIGAQGFSELVDQLRSTPGIDAIVLRINSPGGSAQASDILWHRLRTLGKDREIPIVASVGGMAASGGYYIACAADKIVAEPTSLVGSIGVFGGKVDVSGLYGKLRLSNTTVKTHPSADAESPSRGFTDAERAILQASMDDTYRRFLGVVAGARKKTTEQVDSIGEGRVFTGRQGLAVGLVDTLGGLDVAIRLAATLAGVPKDRDVQTVHLSRDNSWRTELGAIGPESSFAWLDWLKDLERDQVWAYWPGATFE